MGNVIESHGAFDNARRKTRNHNIRQRVGRAMTVATITSVALGSLYVLKESMENSGNIGTVQSVVEDSFVYNGNIIEVQAGTPTSTVESLTTAKPIKPSGTLEKSIEIINPVEVSRPDGRIYIISGAIPGQPSRQEDSLMSIEDYIDRGLVAINLVDVQLKKVNQAPELSQMTHGVPVGADTVRFSAGSGKSLG